MSQREKILLHLRVGRMQGWCSVVFGQDGVIGATSDEMEAFVHRPINRMQ
jgi:hypothetical protein